MSSDTVGRSSKVDPHAGPTRVITPRTMERRGRELGRPYELSLEPPFVHRVTPDPPKDSREMPGPVAEVGQLAVRKTGDIERDYYREDERLRQEVAAGEKTVARAAGLTLPAPSQHMSALLYVPLMFAFGISEACVNVVIFLVMAMSQTSTYIASLMLACGLPVLAHYAGKSWKQTDHAKHSRSIMWTTVGAAVVIVTAIAVVRCAYVSATMQDLVGVRLSPVLVALIFWGLNLAIFVAAVVASHAHAVEDPEGEELGREVIAAEDRLVRNKERLRTLRHEFRTLCEQCDADFKALAAAFDRGNMKARRRVDPGPTAWPQYLPSIPIPEVLRRDSDPTDSADHIRRLVPQTPEDDKHPILTSWTISGNGRPRDDR